MRIKTEYTSLDLLIDIEQDIETVQSYGVYEDNVEVGFRIYLDGEELTSIEQLKDLIKNKL